LQAGYWEEGDLGGVVLNTPTAAEKILFVCSQNKLRSPTAEQIFSRQKDIEVASAGTNQDAEIPVTAELIEWADIIFVMERSHRGKLRRRFAAGLKSTRLICLDIPDNFEFMDPELIRILEARVPRFLRSVHRTSTPRRLRK
jgi:predicted protein tyrosine phosphatase